MEGTHFEDSNPTKVDLSNNETVAVCEEHASHENCPMEVANGNDTFRNLA